MVDSKTIYFEIQIYINSEKNAFTHRNEQMKISKLSFSHQLYSREA